jgi:ADP-L-glycero-D-manno-heptose 6-epimerase
MKAIVTGGAGFIGNNLVAALNARGCDDIIVVDNLTDAKQRNLDRVTFARYLDKSDFRKKLLAGDIPDVDTVFHLGACSSTMETDEAYLADNNFLYTRQLCEWALAKGARFVYASSAATYGDGSEGYSDAHALIPSLKPLNLYGQSKQMFDLWALQNGLLDSIVGLKYFNVYGPWEDHKGPMRSLVQKAYAQIKETGGIKLFKSHRPDYEDGRQERDFVYVRDAVDVTLFFHDHPNVSGIFNCGTGQARTWVDLAEALFTAMDLPPAISFIPMPVEIRDNYQYHTQSDVAKLRAADYETRWTSIEDGVADYVRGYLAQQDATN